jgi:outer membrane immunogenic protein
VASLTAGKVFPLGGSKAGTGPMLDLRGSVAYTHAVGNPFLNVHSDQQKYTFSTWTGSAGATLFVNQTLANNAILRPYIQGYVRHEWGYTNEFTAIEAIQTGGTPLGTFSFDQDHFYKGVDVGLTYALQNMVFSASLYAESSADETTYGGRLGLGWKFEGSDIAKAKAAAHRGPYSWTGFYVGANAGYAWGEAETGANTACEVTDGYFCQYLTDNTSPLIAGTARAAAVSATGSGTIDATGFVGGVQGGGNWQKGNMVVGFEIDANAFRLDGSRSATGIAPAMGALPAAVHTVGSSIETNWLMTARTRFGWAFSDVMVYGTVGLALTDIKLATSYSDDAGAAMSASNTDVRAGFVLGGGLEWALRKDWTVKAEYLYVDFGDVNTYGVVTGPGGQASTYEVSADLNAHIARIGVNRRF